MRLEEVRLYVLLTEGIAAVPIVEAARAAIRGGADALQLRLKNCPDREVLAIARDLRRLTRDQGIFFVVNDRPDIAILAAADAVHVGQDDLPAAAVRALAPAGMRVGVSTHSLEQAREAIAAGADHVGVGPIYATETRGYAAGKGLGLLRAVAAEVRVPIIAIGGITTANAAAARAAGAGAVAVCRAVLAAPDIEAATRQIKEALAHHEEHEAHEERR